MTRSELKQLTEYVLESKIYRKLASIEGDYKVNVRYIGTEYVPEVSIDTGDDHCRIKVSTRPIEDKDGVPGWEFVPTVVNASISEKIGLDNIGEVKSRFDRWAKIAQIAEDLYQIDFYPSYYEED